MHRFIYFNLSEIYQTIFKIYISMKSIKIIRIKAILYSRFHPSIIIALLIDCFDVYSSSYNEKTERFMCFLYQSISMFFI